MTLCRFFQQGYCKNGNNCRFEHPDSNANRFAAFGGGGGGNNGRPKEIPYSLSKDVIQKDLTEEKPTWILSAYGPGRDAPEQLFGGFPREQSFEEVRLVYEEGVLMGNPQGALAQIESIYRDADGQIQNALNNLDGALDYILSAERKTPNRLTPVVNNTSGVFAVGRAQAGSNPFGGGQNSTFGAASTTTSTFGAPSTTTAFGAPSTTTNAFGAASTTTGGFGQPSTLGQKPSPFGAPAFGQPSQPPPTSAFGQPSTMGGTSAFGQPSALGGGGSAFGQASALGQRPSAFGTPAFGQLSQPAATATPAFGQASTMGATPGFGQPSALGSKPNPFGGTTAASPSPFSNMGTAPNNTPSPFGQPAALNSNSSPFGQPAAPAATPSPFGQPAASTATPSPFGQPSALGGGGFGQPSTLGQKPSPFAQAASSSPFGAAQPAADQSMDMSGATPTQAQSGFGAPAAAPVASNPFQQAAKPAVNPFGQPSAPAAAGNPFGAPTPAQPAAAAAAPAGSGPYGPNATRQHPPASSYSSKNADGTLCMFKGKSVAYQKPREGGSNAKAFPAIRNFDGTFTRVWNPDGPPAYYRDTEAAPEAYDAKTKATYEGFMNTGMFQGGIIPEVPPLREWCMWDF